MPCEVLAVPVDVEASAVLAVDVEVVAALAVLVVADSRRKKL